ncbi:MAG: tetraacyldisaccharide 4'-kinase [Lautropia sp.]|nr:tetraacyldisaccharide 4'-kinase [Lautropia sp.]
MNGEALRRRLEAWLHRIWFGPASASDRLLESLTAPVLRPLSWIVAMMARRRRRQLQRTSARTPGPAVIVIGNLVAGGSGKTPLVLALCKALSTHGFQVGLIARGYRRSADEPLLVDAGTPVRQAGDEALLLAQASGRPVAVCARRRAALQLLMQHHPGLDVVLSDDGLQHTALPRRLELVVMHAKGLGNGRCLPAGPLREPADRLDTVDAVLLPAPQSTAATDGGTATHSRSGAPTYPTSTARPRYFHTRVQLTGIRTLDGSQCWSPEDFATRFRSLPLAAVAGIARPERFFQSLTDLGLVAVTPYPLADHAHIDADWLAARPEPWIVMTAKDAVKCRLLAPGLQQRCLVLEIEAVPEPALLKWLIAELDVSRSS